LEVIQLLVERRVDINIHDAALFSAAFSGSLGIIRILLDKEMSVDLTNAEDSTLLNLSAVTGNLEAMKAYVERGAPLNSYNKDGASPLL
jgi:ankyrin repeat protein